MLERACCGKSSFNCQQTLEAILLTKVSRLFLSAHSQLTVPPANTVPHNSGPAFMGHTYSYIFSTAIFILTLSPPPHQQQVYLFTTLSPPLFNAAFDASPMDVVRRRQSVSLQVWPFCKMIFWWITFSNQNKYCFKSNITLLNLSFARQTKFLWFFDTFTMENPWKLVEIRAVSHKKAGLIFRSATNLVFKANLFGQFRLHPRNIEYPRRKKQARLSFSHRVLCIIICAQHEIARFPKYIRAWLIWKRRWKRLGAFKLSKSEAN